MISPMQIEFEKKLHEIGLSYSVNNNDTYVITNQNGGGNQIKVQLILSLQTLKGSHDSKNGNNVQAIGIFKIPIFGQESDLFIFTIQNPIKNKVDFLIIPTDELMCRLVSKNPSSVRHRRTEMVFWVMQDGFVYNTTNISVEAEWYFMSKGIDGRMADETFMDYTKFLNGWHRL